MTSSEESIAHFPVPIKERDLLGFRLEMVKLRVPEDKVQGDQPCLHVGQLVLPSRPQVLPIGRLVHPPGEKVIYTRTGPIRVIARVFPVCPSVATQNQ